MLSFPSFSSLFEVLTAFNFAYILSDDFNKLLNNKIIGSLNRTKQSIDEVYLDMGGIEKSLLSINAIDEGKIKSRKKVDACKDNLNSLKEKFEPVALEITSKIDTAGASKIFSYVSLYAGMYCLIILLYSGFVSSFNPHRMQLCEEGLTVFNFISLAWIGILILYDMKRPEKERKKAFGYIRTLKSFLIVSGVSLVALLIFARFKICPRDLSTITVLSSLCIPSLHFVIYFSRALYNSKYLNAQLNKKLGIFMADYIKFRNAFTTLEIVHQEIETYKENDPEKK